MNSWESSQKEHAAQARWLVKEMHRHDGLAPVNLERFRADQAVAAKDPFGADIPQVPPGVLMNGERIRAATVRERTERAERIRAATVRERTERTIRPATRR